MRFSQILNACERRWRLIAVIAALGTALISSVLLMVLPRYTATALVIDRSMQADDVGGPGGAIQGAADPAIDTEIAMLTTQEHLQRVADSFSGAAPETPANSPEADHQAKENWRVTLKDLQKKLVVRQERRAPVIAVSYTASSPEKAAAVVNRVVQLLIDEQSDKLAANASRSITRFKEQNPAAAAEIKRSRPDGRPEPNLQFLARAFPPNIASSPSIVVLIIVALMGFTVSGALLAIFLDRLDHGLRSAQQVTDALGVPCVGLVPSIDGPGAGRPYRYILDAPYSAYAESIRSLTAFCLQVGTEQPGAKTILVTSSLPEEGKSTLAASLATYAATLNKRVLMLDLSSGQPALLRDGVARVDPGALTSLLSGKPAASFVQHLAGLGFDYAGGSRSRLSPHSSPDDKPALDLVALLADNRLARLLESLRESYDLIVIDGPPVLEMTEARLLASIVDRVLFAVRWGKARADVAYNALQSLKRDASSGLRIGSNTWAVVTRVDIEQHARYRFGDALEFYIRRQSRANQSREGIAAAIKNAMQRSRKTAATSVSTDAEG
jgi:Mrp family chromosome partitioning ATPase/capsular polysaccharide biosynthesis protein